MTHPFPTVGQYPRPITALPGTCLPRAFTQVLGAASPVPASQEGLHKFLSREQKPCTRLCECTASTALLPRGYSGVRSKP